MLIYTLADVYAELIITQLLDFAISLKQGKPTTKVTKRHERIALVHRLLLDSEHQSPTPDFAQCVATYYSLYDDMLAMQQAIAVEPLAAIDKLAAVQVQGAKFRSVYEFLMRTKQTQGTFSESMFAKFTAALGPLRSGISVKRVGKNIVLQQKTVLRKSNSQALPLKPMIASYLFDCAPLPQKLRFYALMHKLVAQIEKLPIFHSQDAKLIYGGGTGQLVSILPALNSAHNAGDCPYKPGDIDLKVALTDNMSLESVQEQLIEVMVQACNSEEYERLFEYVEGEMRVRGGGVGFYRNIKTNGAHLNEYYRLKMRCTPMLFDRIDIFDHQSKVASVFRLSYMAMIQCPDARVLECKLDCLDVTITFGHMDSDSEDPRIQRALDCARLLQQSQQYQRATVDEVSAAIHNFLQNRHTR